MPPAVAGVFKEEVEDSDGALSRVIRTRGAKPSPPERTEQPQDLWDFVLPSRLSLLLLCEKRFLNILATGNGWSKNHGLLPLPGL